MSHFRSNRRDLEFNLFEVHRIQDYIGAISDVEPDTARDIVAEVDRLATNEWAASFVDADRHEVELVNREVKLPDSMKASLAAFESAGWGLLGLPEAIGGTPVPPTLFWACQELLLGSNPTAMFYMGGPLFARVLFDEGTPEQQSIARIMIDRNWGGTMVLTEPDAGSDVGAGTTKATHIDGDRYHIEGIKRFITAGEHDGVENIIHFVLARVPGAQEGTKGLSMFIVPKFHFNEHGELGERNGVYATNVERKMGLKGSSTCEMAFGLEHPAVGYLVGNVHDGIRQMFRVIEHARMTIGTKSASTLSTGYLNALEYAKQRQQGSDLTEATNKAAPKVEIIAHPNVRRMLMLQKAHAEGLRALWSYAAFCQDQALVSDDPGPWEQRSEFLLPLVKGYSSEKAYEMLALSLQVLGGSGYTKDYPMEQYLRDAKIDTVYEGTTGIQALDLFFRKIARDQGVTVSRLSSDIVEFVKGGTGMDGLESERETLGRMLDDTQAHLGVMVGHAMAAVTTEPSAIYKTALHANALLESLAEVVIGWQLLRHGEVAMSGPKDDPFYAGKLAAASFFVAHVSPKIAARRHAAEIEDGALMALDTAAF